MKNRYHTGLSGEGWYYLLVLAFVFGVAMLKEMNLLVLTAGMLLGPLVVSWRMVSVTVQGLKARRRMPRGVSAGDSLVATLELENGRRKVGCWGITVEDEIRREGDPPGTVLRPRVWFPYVAAGDSLAQAYRGQFPRRGKYRFGPMTISTRFPFGLFRRSVRIPSDDSLTVYPRLGRLTGIWNRRHHEAVEGARHRERRQGRTTGEFFGTREWRHGDSRRWIHWRSSARHGALVVRQFEQHRNRDLAVLADLWQPERPEPCHLASVELAVSFAATLVTAVCREETSGLVLGITGPEPVCIEGLATAALRNASMEQLAIAEASHHDGLADLLDKALARVTAGAEVILITTRQVDLTGRAEMAGRWRTATRRTLLRRLRIVNAADQALSELFQVDF